MRSRKLIPILLYNILIVFLILPFFQELTRWIISKPLKGALTNVPAPVFSWKSFFSEEFQPAFEAYRQQECGFRADFIRLNNQLDYTLFKHVHARQVIVGKENYLFESNYIKDYTGELFVGEEIAEHKLAQIRFLQEKFKEKNIDLVVVFMPGKATFYPEYIPDQFRKDPANISNYHYFSNRCKELGINHIDFNAYFLSLKDTVSWPIYPKYGIHWSVYGMALCADSLFNYIGKLRDIPMVDFGWDGLELSARPRDTDYDLGEGLNLIWPLKTATGAYPRFYFRESAQTVKPDVLVIADSFYWTIFGNGISARVFNKNTFWFYFEQEAVTEALIKEKTPETIKEDIEQHQVVLLMSSESNLYKFPFGFSERVYPMYFPEDRPGQEASFRQLARWDKGWFDQVQQAAAGLGVALEQQLTQEAGVTATYGDSAQAELDAIRELAFAIRADPVQMENIRTKAAAINITEDSMLRQDALYIWKNQRGQFRYKYWPRKGYRLDF